MCTTARDLLKLMQGEASKKRTSPKTSRTAEPFYRSAPGEPTWFCRRTQHGRYRLAYGIKGTDQYNDLGIVVGTIADVRVVLSMLAQSGITNTEQEHRTITHPGYYRYSIHAQGN